MVRSPHETLIWRQLHWARKADRHGSLNGIGQNDRSSAMNPLNGENGANAESGPSHSKVPGPAGPGLTVLQGDCCARAFCEQGIVKFAARMHTAAQPALVEDEKLGFPGLFNLPLGRAPRVTVTLKPAVDGIDPVEDFQSLPIGSVAVPDPLGAVALGVCADEAPQVPPGTPPSCPPG